MNFDKCVCDYLDGKIDKEELSKSFYWLAERLIDHLSADRLGIDREDAIQEAVQVCWQKLSRYNREKGHAYNFFTTITMCWFRQICRGVKNYRELKEMYLQRYIKS